MRATGAESTPGQCRSWHATIGPGYGYGLIRGTNGETGQLTPPRGGIGRVAWPVFPLGIAVGLAAIAVG
jgi:hypothetical protein